VLERLDGEYEARSEGESQVQNSQGAEQVLEVSRVSQGLEGRAGVKNRERARCSSRKSGLIASNEEKNFHASRSELVMSRSCQKLECPIHCGFLN
jgi:hypothetical protein